LGKIKAEGYNSVIDFFDAGSGADTPIRTLTNEGFSVVGSIAHETLSITTELERFLEHYGVKGIGWEKKVLIGKYLVQDVFRGGDLLWLF